MKVLHVSNIANIGFGLTNELRNNGIDAHLLCLNRPILDDLPTNTNWIIVSHGKLERLFLSKVNLSDFDLIHAHYLTDLLSLGLFLRSFKAPLILHAHGTDVKTNSFYRKTLREQLGKKSKILFYSTPDLLELCQWYQGELVYIPNFSILSQPTGEIEKYSDRVLIHARLTESKNIDKIFPIIKNTPYQYDIISIGEAVEYYKNKAPNNVNFIDPVPHSIVQNLISKYPLVIGKQNGTIGVSEIESMQLGIPTLFPFKYNHFYDEDLPMVDIKESHITQIIEKENPPLGIQQKKWVDKYHNLKKITKTIIRRYQELL